MADTAIEHAERIATLETKMEALTESVKEQTKKIDELLTIVQQARGARYALMGAGGVIGAIITYASLYAAKIGAVLQAVSK
jgi:hypothetical protein